MSAIDEIQAAIDKLTDLKTRATDSPWYVKSSSMPDEASIVSVHGNPIIIGGSYAMDESTLDGADAQLIVTLIDTIDIQLAILHETLFQLSGSEHARGFIGNEFTLFARLAGAINGATS